MFLMTNLCHLLSDSHCLFYYLDCLLIDSFRRCLPTCALLPSALSCGALQLMPVYISPSNSLVPSQICQASVCASFYVG